MRHLICLVGPVRVYMTLTAARLDGHTQQQQHGHTSAAAAHSMLCVIRPNPHCWCPQPQVKHPGRTLVFVNAVSATRRLAALLGHLGVKAMALHASQQQRQRLKVGPAGRSHQIFEQRSGCHWRLMS